MLPPTADVVVVGAGGFGAAVAYGCARVGLRVLVLDRSAPATETSAMAAGIGMHVHPTAAGSRLAIRSAELVAALPEETGLPLEVHRAGSIKVARTPLHAEIVAREIAFGRSLGVAVDPLDRAEAEALAPWLDLAGATAISTVRPDLHFEPPALPRLYLAAAERLGATVRGGVAVLGVRAEGGRVTGVDTAAGPVAAGAVVLAAGAWTPRLARPLGCAIPAVPVQHELFVTTPIAGTSLDQPHVRVMDANAWARPYAGGLMLGAYEATPPLVDVDASPDGLPPGLASPPAALAERAAPVLDVIPALREARAVEVRAGVMTMSPDGMFIVDALDGTEGAFAIAGDNVMGLHVTPAVGEGLAGWIAHGRCPELLAPFGLARFAGRDPEELRRAAIAQYATKYQHLDEDAEP